jgi:hypothetical protein
VYYRFVKTPPDSPEFSRFTQAMRSIVGVSKVEIQKRIEAEKKRKSIKAPASLATVSSARKTRQTVSVSRTLPIGSA